MARLVNSENGVVVNVSDEKVERFDARWSPADEAEKAPAKSTARKSASSDSK